MPEVLAGSAEFREINSPDSYKRWNDELSRLARELKTMDGGMPKMKYAKHPTIQKGTLLLFAHMTRLDMSSYPQELQDDQRAMLEHVPKLMNTMIELTCSRRWF